MKLFNYKIRGTMKVLTRKAEREIQFVDGVLTGDEMLIAEIKHKGEVAEIYGDFPNGYSPVEDEFATDALAVILLMHEVCDNVKISGNYPKWDTTGEDKGQVY